VIQEGHEQQYRGREGEWWMRKRKQDSAYLERDRRTGGDYGKAEFSDALADQPDHRDQVVEIIQKLREAFHGNSLANDGQHRAAAFRVARLGISLIERRDVRLFRMGYCPMKQLPALPCGLILEKDHWRFSFLALV